VLRQSVNVPPKDVATELDIDSEAAVLCVERVRKLDGEPLAYHEAFIPYPLAKKIQDRDLSNLAIFHELERVGESLIEEWHRIDATVADTLFAKLLRIAFGAPLLVITRRLRARDGVRVLFRTHFRADRYYYTIALAPMALTRPIAGRQKRRTGVRTTHVVSGTEDVREAKHG